MLNKNFCKQCRKERGLDLGVAFDGQWNIFVVECEERGDEHDIREMPHPNCHRIMEQIFGFEECKKHIMTYYNCVYDDQGVCQDYEEYEVEQDIQKTLAMLKRDDARRKRWERRQSKKAVVP
jgi:hypothetical protein